MVWHGISFRFVKAIMEAMMEAMMEPIWYAGLRGSAFIFLCREPPDPGKCGLIGQTPVLARPPGRFAMESLAQWRSLSSGTEDRHDTKLDVSRPQTWRARYICSESDGLRSGRMAATYICQCAHLLNACFYQHTRCSHRKKPGSCRVKMSNQPFT